MYDELIIEIILIVFSKYHPFFELKNEIDIIPELRAKQYYAL